MARSYPTGCTGANVGLSGKQLLRLSFRCQLPSRSAWRPLACIGRTPRPGQPDHCATRCCWSHVDSGLLHRDRAGEVHVLLGIQMRNVRRGDDFA